MKKITPLLLIMLGIALLATAAYFWFGYSSQTASQDLFKTIGAIFSFLLGAGANIKGWIDLVGRKKNDEEIHVQGDFIKGDKHIHLPPASHVIDSLHQIPSPPDEFVGRDDELTDF